MRRLAAIGIVVALAVGVWIGRRSKSAPELDRLQTALECGKGNAEACARAQSGDTDRCDRGDAQGCVLLGIRLKQDPKALPYFQRACDLNDANGCWYLGMAHEWVKEYEKALAAHQKGCDLGTYVNACDALGSLYEHGQGVAKDRERALAIYRAACTKFHGTGFPCSHAHYLEDGGR